MTEHTSTDGEHRDRGEPSPDVSDVGDGSGASELIRDALVDDDDPRFPVWLPVPGIALAAGWALYAAAAAEGSFVPTLIWPGLAIFLGATLATWLGWQLDID